MVEWQKRKNNAKTLKKRRDHESVNSTPVSSQIKVEGNDAGSFHIDPNSTGGTQETLIGQANGDLRLLSGAGSYQANRANILLKNYKKYLFRNNNF